MKFLNKLFGVKDKNVELEPELKLPETNEEEAEIIGECEWCRTPILSVHKWSKQQGMKFHRKCYQKMLKAGRGQ